MNRFCLILLSFALMTGCAWESDLVDRYVETNGAINLCPGVCLGQDGFEKKDCKSNHGEWIEETETCIISERGCKNTSGQNGVWRKYQVADLGKGRYIRFNNDQYYCGRYDALFSAHTGNNEDLTCTPEEIERFEDSLMRSFCEAGSRCMLYNNRGASPGAMCSRCGHGEVMCMTGDEFQCTDILNNKEHCGACDVQCGENQVCRKGLCTGASSN